MSFLKKYSSEKSLENLIKIADILDRLDEDDLANYVDDLNGYLKSDLNESIEIEVPEEEQDILSDVLNNLAESLAQRIK